MSKTSPARWYRDRLPQADGWALHCLLAGSEPAMAAVVEPFRDTILAGPPTPMPYTPPRPLDSYDFLAGCAYLTTDKPWRDMPRAPTATRSPYLRDRLADMPVFRDRATPLPMRPLAQLSRKTSKTLPQQDAQAHAAGIDRGLPAFLVAWTPCSAVEYTFDDSIPDGVIEIDGTRITLAEMRAACEGP